MTEPGIGLAGSPTADVSDRLWWTLVGCALINWSVQLLSATTSLSWIAAPVVLAGGWGLTTVLVSWLPVGRLGRGGLGEVWAWTTAFVLVAAFAVWAYTQVRGGPGYGTDELAFDQYAGRLALHGHNPYLHSMGPALGIFHVSPDGYTYTLSGRPVTQLSYPALSFLAYVPFLWLGWSSQLGVALGVGAWAMTVLLMFALLPHRFRPAALVIGSVSVYLSYAVGGVTDVLYMPLLIAAAYGWDRFGAGRWTYAGPIALGLAVSIKQTPWLIVPFVLCALWIDEADRAGRRAAARRTLKYLTATAVPFLACNLPYAVSSPSAWWHGITTPVISHLVPAGQGAIALSLFLRLGGGSLAAFSLATGLLALLLLVVYVGTYPAARTITFILPAVVLFFSSRSYGSYLVSLIPPALVAAVTCRPATGRQDGVSRSLRPLRSRGWGIVIIAGALLFAGSAARALTDPQPLSIRIVGVRTTGQLATIERLRLQVRNRSSHAVAPAFSVDEGDQVTTFWRRVAGPARLAAGQSARYEIASANYPAQPSIAGGFTVIAFSRRPAAVSATGAYTPSATHVALTPAAVNIPVPVGRAVTIRAQLLDTLDRPVRRANVPVYLGQIIYDQSGLELAQTRIDGRPPGQTPVPAFTNPDGIATFRLVGTQALADPVYYEANLVQSRQFFPYGYSDILAIRFRARRAP